MKLGNDALYTNYHLPDQRCAIIHSYTHRRRRKRSKFRRNTQHRLIITLTGMPSSTSETVKEENIFKQCGAAHWSWRNTVGNQKINQSLRPEKHACNRFSFRFLLHYATHFFPNLAGKKKNVTRKQWCAIGDSARHGEARRDQTLRLNCCLLPSHSSS